MALTTVNSGLLDSNAQYTGFKNRILNGQMVIDQRNAGASGTAQDYTVDRWAYYLSQASKITWQQNAGSITPPSGFKNYLGFTSSSSYSVGSGDYFFVQQLIETNNVYDLNLGTANAQSFTLSFWAYSSLTGTFSGGIRNPNGYANSYVFTYSIPVANTWTKISISVPPITSGSWQTTGTSAYLGVLFSLGAGSTYSSSTVNAWQSGNYFNATGSVSVVGTNGATFYITGVQLEKGSTATSFDYRPYGTELQLCQRYYQRLGSLSGGYVGFGSGRGAGGTSVLVYIKYANTVRATPTISQSNTAVNVPSQYAVTSLGTIYYGTDSAGLELNVTTSVASGGAAVWLGNNNSSAYVDISAEL